MRSFSIKLALPLLLTLTACNRDPKQMYTIPPEYQHDWVIEAYDCQNGAAPVEGADGLEVMVPASGVVLHPGARVPTRDSYQQISLDGSVTSIGSSEVETGIGVEMVQKGVVPVPCNYSYILLNKAVTDAQLLQEIQAACQRCESSIAAGL